MSIKTIVELSRDEFMVSHTPLRRVANEVWDFQEASLIAIDLVHTMNESKIAVGLSAPQIGVSCQVAVVNISKDKAGPPLILVNPTVIKETGAKETKMESCMSLPHYRGPVERRQKVGINYFDLEGKEKHLAAEGFLARVLLHEIDHLQGILYVDRMKDLTDLEKVDFFKKP